MKMGAAAVAAALIIAGCAAGHTARSSQQRSASQSGAALRSSELPLPHTAERAYHVVNTLFDRAAAFEIVEYMDQYWRLAGNAGFNTSIDRIRDRLVAAGFSAIPASAPGTVRVDEFSNDGHGWDHRVGTLQFDDGADPVLLSRERERVALAINSFSTQPDGLKARLVDVGSGTASDYSRNDVRGAVVLGDGPLDQLWQDAVKRRGAAGVVSTEIAPYNRPTDPAQMSPEQQDVLQWGSIPYDPGVKGFGFKSSWRAADRMRQRLAQGDVMVRVTIDASFSEAANRSLIAEIPGRSRPAERIVLVAHVQEPGANDNGSGAGTLYGIARALLTAIQNGALPRPERTLTFLWVDEIRGSRQWLTARGAEAHATQYMMALDMTGEDTEKTGGTFLIEKQADPSAVWDRPSDPHTAWGRGQVRLESLKGSLLNDLHVAVASRRARDTGWIVRTNPYEGGSDHTVFANAGVPSLLNWHFTDRFYHTNQDRLDKVSAGEMQNVGVTVATTAWVLATADEEDAIAVADLVAAAGTRRLSLERSQGSGLVERAADKKAAEDVERRVKAAWLKWYAEALDSGNSLPATAASNRLRDRITDAKRGIGAPSSR